MCPSQRCQRGPRRLRSFARRNPDPLLAPPPRLNPRATPTPMKSASSSSAGTAASRVNAGTSHPRGSKRGRRLPLPLTSVFPLTEKCVRVHWHLPFRWQALDSDGVTWKDLPAMEDIERAYSDPCNDTSCTKPLSPPSRILSFLSLQRCMNEGTNRGA